MESMLLIEIEKLYRLAGFKDDELDCRRIEMRAGEIAVEIGGGIKCMN
jgi:hypothetical protein